MVQDMCIASFICNSFQVFDAWPLFYLYENYKLKNLHAKLERVFDIFVSRILQHRLNDPLLSYYWKALK